MRHQGFTLIELLIVIAIIGILAVVLVPNLLAARGLAQDRATQAYGSNIYKSANAYLAENVNARATDLTLPCGPGQNYSPGGSGRYVVKDPGTIVASCTVTATDPFKFSVAVASASGASFSIP